MTTLNKSELPDYVPQVLKIVKDSLGDSITSVYLFGSSVIGGLRPSSDLDFFVLVKKPLSNLVRQKLVSELMKVSGRKALAGPARPIELSIVNQSDVIPWQYPPKREFQYGEWLREAFENGELSQPMIDPDLAILISKVRDYSSVLLGPSAHDLFEPVPFKDILRATEASLPTLLDDLYGDERNVLLTLARMWMTLSTGEIASKDSAAMWALERLPLEHKEVLELARRAYLGECEDDWQAYKKQVGNFATYVKQAIKACLIV